jgi:formyl-CoA transferase
MNAMNRPDLANDPELAQNDGRAKRSGELDDAIQAWTSTYSLKDALAILEEAAVPSSGINNAEDIFNDPHFRARDMIVEHPLSGDDKISLPGIVPKLSLTPGKTQWLGPKLGEHTEEVLSSLGIDAEKLSTLRANGVI